MKQPPRNQFNSRIKQQEARSRRGRGNQALTMCDYALTNSASAGAGPRNHAAHTLAFAGALLSRAARRPGTRFRSGTAEYAAVALHGLGARKSRPRLGAHAAHDRSGVEGAQPCARKRPP